MSYQNSIRSNVGAGLMACEKFLDKPSTWLAIWLVVGTAVAQAGIFDNTVAVFCSVLGQVLGPKSTLLSLVLVALTGVALVLWWMNEGKEGIMVWIIKTGAVVGVLVNIFSLPASLGMASVSC